METLRLTTTRKRKNERDDLEGKTLGLAETKKKKKNERDDLEGMDRRDKRKWRKT